MLFIIELIIGIIFVRLLVLILARVEFVREVIIVLFCVFEKFILYILFICWIIFNCIVLIVKILVISIGIRLEFIDYIMWL